MNITAMANSYITCALWSTCDENDKPFDKRYDPNNITKDSRLQVEADCRLFVERAGSLLTNWDSSQAGHDFWLSRNGHGAGFFCRNGIEEDRVVRHKLQELAESFGSADIMVKNKSFFWIT